jgi:hypothetical protein
MGDAVDEAKLHPSMGEGVRVEDQLWGAVGSTANRDAYLSIMIPVVVVRKRWGQPVARILKDG